MEYQRYDHPRHYCVNNPSCRNLPTTSTARCVYQQYYGKPNTRNVGHTNYANDIDIIECCYDGS